jgi:predicted RNase H-like HicB family nuclease
MCYNLGTEEYSEATEMTTGTQKITKLKFWVRIVVEKDEPGYHAYAPSLKGLHMGGDTQEEARSNAKEAAALFLKSMIEDGDPIPIDVIKARNKEIIASSRNNTFSSLEEIQVELE